MPTKSYRTIRTRPRRHVSFGLLHLLCRSLHPFQVCCAIEVLTETFRIVARLWHRNSSPFPTTRPISTHSVKQITSDDSIFCALPVVELFEVHTSPRSTANTTSNTSHAQFVLPCSVRKTHITSMTAVFIATSTIRPDLRKNATGVIPPF